jgi:hypothetical protein
VISAAIIFIDVIVCGVDSASPADATMSRQTLSGMVAGANTSHARLHRHVRRVGAAG